MAASWYRPKPNAYGWYPQAPTAPRTFKPFTPYQTPTPPPGTYDPNLDAALGQAQRGFGDLQQDVGTQRLRAAQDYGIGTDQINQQTGYSQQDIDTQLAQGHADNIQQQARNTEDYGSQIATLQRAYAQLQGQQAEGDRHSGVTSAGIQMLQAAKRAQNQAIDRQPIDTGYQRAQQDVNQADSRLYSGAMTQSGRLQQTAKDQIANLALGYTRTTGDLSNQLDRGEREVGQFGIDTLNQKSAQATQLGWSIPEPGAPGGKPLNQHTSAQGQTFQTVKSGGWVYQVDPSGKVLNKRRAKS